MDVKYIDIIVDKITEKNDMWLTAREIKNRKEHNIKTLGSKEYIGDNSLYKLIFDKMFFNTNESIQLSMSRDIVFNIVELEDMLKNMSNGLFYIKNNPIPFLTIGERYMYGGNEYVINTIDDIELYLVHGHRLHIYINDTLRLVTIDDFSKIKDNINNHPSIGHLLNHICLYITSNIMMHIHPESDIVVKDILNISDNLLLVNDSSYKFDTINEYIASIYLYNNYLIDNLLSSIYSDISEYVLSNIDLESTDSYDIKYSNNGINIKKYVSPSSVRYLVNIKII